MHDRPDTNTLWSERQVAVYHRYDMDSKSSIWLILQAPTRIKRIMKDIIAAASGKRLTLADHMSLHLLFFVELGSKWRRYINYMEEQLAELVRIPLHH